VIDYRYSACSKSRSCLAWGGLARLVRSTLLYWVRQAGNRVRPRVNPERTPAN